jgi:hypothetical protein
LKKKWAALRSGAARGAAQPVVKGAPRGQAGKRLVQTGRRSTQALFFVRLCPELATARYVHPNPTPPSGLRKRGAGGGYPLARQSRMEPTTPCRCGLPVGSAWTWRMMRCAVPALPVGRPSGTRTRRSEAARLDTAAMGGWSSGNGRLAATSPRLLQGASASEPGPSFGGSCFVHILGDFCRFAPNHYDNFADTIDLEAGPGVGKPPPAPPSSLERPRAGESFLIKLTRFAC